MISYGTPTCSTTQRPAELFCYTGNCAMPAFVCQSKELSDHNHDIDMKCQLWNSAFPAVRRAIEREIQPADIAALERQEKQLQMLVDELKTIQQNHRQVIQQVRQRQQLTKAAEKVLTAIQTGATDAITGNDMAQLVKAIQTNEVYKNGKRVNEIIKQRSELTDEMLTKLNALITEHKQRENSLPKP